MNINIELPAIKVPPGKVVFATIGKGRSKGMFVIPGTYKDEKGKIREFGKKTLIPGNRRVKEHERVENYAWGGNRNKTLSVEDDKKEIEWLRDNPFNATSASYKKLMGYRATDEKNGVPLNVTKAFFIEINPAEIAKTSLAKMAMGQKAHALIKSNVGSIDENGNVKMVSKGDEKLESLYYLLTSKDKDTTEIMMAAILDAAVTNPASVVSAMDDDTKEMKTLMANALSVGILKMEGEKIMYGEVVVGTKVTAIDNLSTNEGKYKPILTAIKKKLKDKG